MRWPTGLSLPRHVARNGAPTASRVSLMPEILVFAALATHSVGNSRFGACRRFACWILALWVLGLIAQGSLSPAPAQTMADPALAATTPARLVIRNDRGGRVGKRAAEITRLRATGTLVEITGRVCLSSCTMFLGLPTTCIHPTTIFGFHGPSHFGTPLSDYDFRYWSHVIAAHYPKALRQWYLRKGRYKRFDYYHISGQQLIRLGVQECGATADNL